MPPPSFDKFSHQRRGMKRAAYKRHAKINIPVDFIISIHHDARHTLQFRCLFDAYISTNCACLIWPNKLRSFHWTALRAGPTSIRYIMTIDVLFTDKSENLEACRSFERIFCKPLSTRIEIFAFSNFVREIRTTTFRIFLSGVPFHLFETISFFAPYKKITRISLSLSFHEKSPWNSWVLSPKWSFLTRLSPVAFRARLWKQRHLGSGTGCILNRIQFIDVDGALTCSCHVLGSEAASSSVHSVECTSLARVSNILHALLPLHSRNNFCRARVLPVSFRTRNARN